MNKTLAKVLSAVFVAGLVAAGLVYAQPLFSNNLFVLGGNAGVTPQVQAVGTDPNISINLVPKGTGSVQVNGTPITAGTTFTSLTVSGLATFNGGSVDLFPTLGNNITATLKGGPIRIFHNATQVGNGADATEDTLHSFTLPANGLNVVGESLRIWTYVQNAATANGKRTRIEFGATTIADTGSRADNNNWMVIFCDVFMTGAATQKSICSINNTGNAGFTGNGNTILSTPGETLSGAVLIKVTGTSATSTANDMLAQITTIDLWPNGQ